MLRNRSRGQRRRDLRRRCREFIHCLQLIGLATEFENSHCAASDAYCNRAPKFKEELHVSNQNISLLTYTVLIASVVFLGGSFVRSDHVQKAGRLPTDLLQQCIEHRGSRRDRPHCESWYCCNQAQLRTGNRSTGTSVPKSMC